jgi:galactose mutarotase-like enzyme
LYPQMPSHGTDRISPMGVAWVAENEVVLETTEGPRTFRGAWKTTLRVRLSYSGGHLSIYQTVENLEPGFRERAVAFHPYFVNPGDMQVLNPKALLVPPPLGEASLCDGNYQVIYRVGGFVVHLLSSPTPVTLVDWRDDDSFRCIEPWWGGEGHGVVFEPGEKKTFKLKLRVFKDSG